MPGRGLDRARPDLRPVRRRGPPAPGLHAGPEPRRSHRGRHANAAEVAFSYSNAVRRVFEDPRVTLPYTEAQWAAIDALGRAVDADLAAGDVRLTLGGEPTFVSVDDMAGDEWNTAPSGRPSTAWRSTSPGAWSTGSRPPCPASPGRSSTTARASGIRASRCPAGTSPSTGGPTACRCGRTRRCWPRRRRRPWSRTTRTQDGDEPPAPQERGDRPGDTGARDLAVAVAGRLGIPADYCVPAYEDPAHELWTGRTAPDAATPGPPRGPLDRSSQGPPAGSSAITRAATSRRWATTRWEPARGHIFLVPGDSPLGLRLPLRSLVAKPEPLPPDRSPFEERRPLGPRPSRRRRARGPRRPPGEGTHHRPVRRAARRAPPRLPPAVRPPRARRRAAGRRRVGASPPPGEPVGARGLSPARRPPPGPVRRQPRPRRDRGQRPAGGHAGPSSWTSSPASTTRPDQPASAPRSSHLDGTHAGTGGGNHLTLGGPTAADSPLLRRPDLLRSLITYWQHHPSLSYLFSGRFIGPTSQAPRVDEARHDSALRARDRLRRARPPGAATSSGRGWSTGCSATCSSTSRATPTGPSSASTSCSARTPSAAGSASSSCGRSRCRPTPGWRWCRRCWCGRWSPGAGASPYRGAARPVGHRAARPVPPALLRRRRHRRRGRRPAPPRLRVRAGVAGAVPRVPLPPPRCRRRRRGPPRAAHGHRAVVGARRGGQLGGGTRPPRRLVGRAAAGPRRGLDRRAATW